MNFNIFHPRSLKAKVPLLTLAIFLIGIWSLAIFESRMLREDMRHMLSDHPNAFLGKPYQLKGLRDTISQVLANKA